MAACVRARTCMCDYIYIKYRYLQVTTIVNKSRHFYRPLLTSANEFFFFHSCWLLSQFTKITNVLITLFLGELQASCGSPDGFRGVAGGHENNDLCNNQSRCPTSTVAQTDASATHPQQNKRATPHAHTECRQELHITERFCRVARCSGHLGTWPGDISRQIAGSRVNLDVEIPVLWSRLARHFTIMKTTTTIVMQNL